MDNIIELNDIRGGYGKVEVIRGVSFKFKKGLFFGIVGPNGSGKSTLLRLMTRSLEPFAGDVSFLGKDINLFGVKEFCRHTSFVPQDTFIHFSFSVMDIVLMGRIPYVGRLSRYSEKDIEISVNALKLTDTIHLKDRQIDDLSAGERQRVIIARAIAQDTEIIFLDEPTSHLDIGHQVKIMDMLKRLNREKGLTIISVLHDLNLAGAYCDQIMMLKSGMIYACGDLSDVLTYNNIEDVYKTVVVIGKSPFSMRPNVILVSEEDMCRRR